MKKYYFFTLAALAFMGCSEAVENPNSGNSNNGTDICGNGVVDKAAGEVCDTARDMTCLAVNSTKTWISGKPTCNQCKSIEIGTCVEAPNSCGKPEAKCEKGKEYPCSELDSTKEWKDGGMAKCSDDCTSIAPNTCVQKSVCGDGILQDDEKCDKALALTVTCYGLDATKNWKDGGAPSCASDCSKILIGTCVEDTTTPPTPEDPEDPVDPEVPSSKCGNSIIDAGETCEFTGKKACKEIDKKWTSGEATCNECVLDDSKCVLNETKSGLYFCQLLGPVIVTFNSDKKSEKMTVKYNIGNDVNESGMTAELVYGNDFKHMSKWKTIAATQNASADTFTATLTDANVLSVGSADSSAYYTFRIKANNSADWQYCKRNNPNNYADPNIIDTTIASPYNLKSDGEISSNKNETGMATVSSVLAGNMIAEFNFNDATKTVSSHKANTPYAADDGKGTFVGDGKGNSYAQCNSNQCFVNGNGSGKAINLKNWVTSSADALDSNNVPQKAHITLKEMSTIGASGIDLKLDVWRNAAESATNIIVIYSTDGTSFTYVNDINLNTEKLKQYFTHTVQMPSGIENKSNVTIKLIPYGGNGLLRFDNIIVSQGNE